MWQPRVSQIDNPQSADVNCIEAQRLVTGTVAPTGDGIVRRPQHMPSRQGHAPVSNKVHDRVCHVGLLLRDLDLLMCLHCLDGFGDFSMMHSRTSEVDAALFRMVMGISTPFRFGRCA